ncbi:hypothetical protein [Chryseobacterium lactis]|uniref:hypothetical protein n=1 Tax=Chryseobacterium lactis TaxID=1241981 RepID=UPI001623E71A|nr:hypothetical protein [Chryseobacterium lactis]
MLDVLVYFWLLTIFLFIYNLGRGYFTIVPVVNNWISTEKWDYYQGLNRDKFLIFLFIISLCVIFAYLFIPKVFKSDNWFDFIGFIMSSFFLQLLMTYILERKAPASPFNMLKNFIKSNFDFGVDRTSRNIDSSESSTMSNFHSEKCFEGGNGNALVVLEKILDNTNDIKDVVVENKKKIPQSEFNFELKNNSNLDIFHIEKEYSISIESRNVLKDFLSRNKISGKIIFTKSAGTGPSVKEIFYFFSTFTNIFEIYKDEKLTQEEVIKIINKIVVGTYKGKQIESPIHDYNVSKYFSRKGLGKNKR